MARAPRITKAPKIKAGSVAIDVIGERRLIQVFNLLKGARQRRAIRPAVTQATRLLKKASKKAAPKRTGRMAKSIDAKIAVVPKKKRQKLAIVGRVGVKSKTKTTARDAGKLAQTNTGTDARKTKSGANRGQITGRKYLQKVHQRTKAAMRAKFRAVFRERMLREIQRIGSAARIAG